MATTPTSPCDEAIILTSGPASPSCSGGVWVLAATILGSSLAFIDGTVVNVALPALQSAFRADMAQVQWVVESYALLLAALLLTGGSLGDLYGRRIIFAVGVVVFALASAFCGLSQTIAQLVFARAIQGVGGALLVPGSLALISASFPAAERGRAIGTWSGFTAITAAIGPVLGGWIVQHGSWRWVFFLNLPIAAVVLLITLWRVRESRNNRVKQSLDWPGALLITIGLGGIVLALIEASYRLPAALVGVAACLAFAFVETRATAPMLPFALFRSRNFTGANLLTLFLYTGVSGLFFFMPLNLIQVQGYSTTAAGASLLPLILTIFVMSRWSGGLVDRFGPKLPLVIGPLVAASGFALFALPSIGGSYWVTVFPGALVLGFGMAITVAPLTTTVMNSVHQRNAGIASGINNAVSRVAGLLAIAIFGLILLNVFSRSLFANLNQASVPEPTRTGLLSQRYKLAAIETRDPRARAAIGRSFVAGYRTVLWLAVGLCLASSLSAVLLIQAGKNKELKAGTAP